MTQENYEDYLDYLQPSEEVPLMQQLYELVESQLQSELRLAELEQKFNAEKEFYKELSEEKIPEIMELMSVDEMKLSSGATIKVDEKLRASIPKARSEETFSWMRERGYGGLIRHNVIFDFSVGEDEVSEKSLNHVSEEWCDLEYAEKTTVHPSTLNSFVKKRLEAGEDLPLELFGIFRQRVAVIKTGSASSKKKKKK